MSSIVQFQANDWLVFLDGVQIPFISFTYAVGVNAVAQGTLIIEPDGILTTLRPNAVVSIFFRDNYPNTQSGNAASSIEDTHVYFGGGEVTSFSMQKRPESKTVQLTFSHELGILNQHKAVATGISGSFTSIVVTGSTVLDQFQVNQRDMFSIASLDPLQAANAKTQTDYSFGSNILGTIAWCSSGSVSLRNRISQHRLMNKFASLDSSLVRDLITRKLGQSLLTKVQDTLRGDESILSVISALNEVPEYRFFSTITPHYVTGEKFKKIHKPIIYPLNRDTDAAYANQYYTRQWARHDTLLLPNMHFSAPPPCNLIFPDMIQGISYTRMFNSEPTRTFLEETVGKAVQRLMFASTDTIPGIKAVRSPVEFWGSVEQMFQTQSDVDNPLKSESPYIRVPKKAPAPPLQRETINLLNSISDSELAKGIISAKLSRDSEYMLAVSASALTEKSTTADVSKVINSVVNPKDRFVNLDVLPLPAVPPAQPSDDTTKFIQYTQALVDYRHRLGKFNRQAEIAVKGHRWLTPGFTGAVFDQEMLLMFLIDGVTYTVDATGDETSNISVSHVRPILDVPVELVTQVSKLTNDVEKLRTAINDQISAVYDSERLYVNKLLKEIIAVEAPNVIEQFKKSVLSAQGLNFIKETANRFIKLTNIGNSVLNDLRVNNTTALLNYLRKISILVAIGEQVFAKTLGPNRSTAGAITTQRNTDLAKEWLDLTASASSADSIKSIDDAVTNLNNFASRLSTLITNTLDEQEDQALAGEPAFASTVAGETKLNKSLVSDGEALNKAEAALRQLLNQIENTYDIPLPPDFFPKEFINLKKLDDIYQQTLGTKSNFYSDILDKVLSKDKTLLTANSSDNVINHTNMKKAFEYIYNQQWANEVGRSDRNGLDWQHRNMLNRGHQTLREYLETHGFKSKLNTNISSEPSPTIFYQMVPRDLPYPAPKVFDPGGNPTGFVWDDSVISRLVDSVATSQTPLKINDTQVGQSGSFDPLVKERREIARDPSLSGAFRQQQIINYSRRHMGSRAYRND